MAGGGKLPIGSDDSIVDFGRHNPHLEGFRTGTARATYDPFLQLSTIATTAVEDADRVNFDRGERWGKRVRLTDFGY